MKVDITRQPFLLASASSLLLVGVGTAFKLPFDVVQSGTAAPLGAFASAFQRSCPVWSAAAVFAIAVCCGYSLTRSSVRYDLYARRTYLAMVFFSLVSCCLFGGGEWLRNWCALAVLLLACRNYSAGFKRSYRFGEMFRGSFFLGTVPLIYAPAAILLLLMPAMLFLFRRPAREVPAAVVGLCLPAAIASYVWWACGYDIGYVVCRTIDAATVPSGFSLFSGVSLPELAAWGVTLFIVLTTIGVYMSEYRVLKFKARRIHIYYIVTAVLCFSTFALSGSDEGSLLLLSIPCAMVMPLLFVRASVRFSLLLYVSLVAAVLASVFLR